MSDQTENKKSDALMRLLAVLVFNCGMHKEHAEAHYVTLALDLAYLKEKDVDSAWLKVVKCIKDNNIGDRK